MVSINSLHDNSSSFFYRIPNFARLICDSSKCVSCSICFGSRCTAKVWMASDVNLFWWVCFQRITKLKMNRNCFRACWLYEFLIFKNAFPQRKFACESHLPFVFITFQNVVSHICMKIPRLNIFLFNHISLVYATWIRFEFDVLGVLGNFSEILIKLQNFSFMKLHLKHRLWNVGHFLLGGNELKEYNPSRAETGILRENEIRDTEIAGSNQDIDDVKWGGSCLS